MKYLSQPIFASRIINSANTSVTSTSFEIKDVNHLWVQLSGTSNSSPDLSIQLQLSNDPVSKSDSNSTWINDNSAATFSGTSTFDKHVEVTATKARLVVTRNSGATLLNASAFGKSSKKVWSASSPAPTWPTGADGDLVLDGVNLDLNQGDIKDYNSITMINGGGINITEGGEWVIIGCKGDFIGFDGSFIHAYSNNSEADGTFTATAPDGRNLSYSIVQKAGGNGGDSGSGVSGGAAAAGGGGGGGSQTVGQDAGSSNGGDGGGSNLANGGTGGVYQSGNNFPDHGTDGDQADAPTDVDTAIGGGAGGGPKGSHGQGLYIKVLGDVNLEDGFVIDVGGRPGGNGGAGGNANSQLAPAYGGGGGGAGAGGSGGKMVIRYGTATNLNTSFLLIAGGTKGTVGIGGIAFNAGPGVQVDGNPGGAANNGNIGSKDVAAG